jgi:hypothetical protein
MKIYLRTGYAVENTLEIRHALDALDAALPARRPAEGLRFAQV